MNSPKPNPTQETIPQRKPVKSQRERRESKQTDLYLDSILLNGEQVIVNCEVHWGIYWKSAVIMIFALIVCIFVWQIGLILLIAGVFGLIHSYLMTRMLLLVLTNKRVLMRYGILQVDVVDMRFKNIESIELERMVPGFLLGYSNVIVMGIGQRVIRIPYLSNAVTFRRAFNELVLGDTDEEIRDAVQVDREIVVENSSIPPVDKSSSTAQ